jgi:hypothetical protein
MQKSHFGCIEAPFLENVTKDTLFFSNYLQNFPFFLLDTAEKNGIMVTYGRYASFPGGRHGKEN